MTTVKKDRIIEMTVQELEDVKVKAISLVDHGAIRQPFVKIKSKGKDMGKKKWAGFAGLFDRKKDDSGDESEAIKDGVLSAVFVKGEAADKARVIVGDRIKGEESENGITAIFLDENEPDNADLLKLDENASVIVTGLHKYFAEWEPQDDFGKNIAVGGFFPSLEMASKALVGTIYEAMDKAEAGKPPTKKIKAAIADYADYAVMLVKSIPKEVFKLEGLIEKSEPVAPLEVPAGITKAEFDEAMGLVGEQLKAIKPPEVKLDGLAKAEDIEGLKRSVDEYKAEALESHAESTKKLKEMRDKMGLITASVPAADMVKTIKEEKADVFDDAFDITTRG